MRADAAVFPVSAGPARSAYRRALAWAFGAFNSARVLAYLPTLYAIWTMGDADPHSLWTWGVWVCANATMAAWLVETRGGFDRAAAVCAGNAAMCAAICGTIVWFRTA